MTDSFPPFLPQSRCVCYNPASPQATTLNMLTDNEWCGTTNIYISVCICSSSSSSRYMCNMYYLGHEICKNSSSNNNNNNSKLVVVLKGSIQTYKYIWLNCTRICMHEHWKAFAEIHQNLCIFLCYEWMLLLLLPQCFKLNVAAATVLYCSCFRSNPYSIIIWYALCFYSAIVFYSICHKF